MKKIFFMAYILRTNKSSSESCQQNYNFVQEGFEFFANFSSYSTGNAQIQVDEIMTFQVM